MPLPPAFIHLLSDSRPTVSPTSTLGLSRRSAAARPPAADAAERHGGGAAKSFQEATALGRLGGLRTRQFCPKRSFVWKERSRRAASRRKLRVWSHLLLLRGPERLRLSHAPPHPSACWTGVSRVFRAPRSDSGVFQTSCLGPSNSFCLFPINLRPNVIPNLPYNLIIEGNSIFAGAGGRLPWI